ncbi:hypothetical protein [Agrobacterium larrymoorei]|uniref:Uncharacterized protein n=1 Tax=Agrobacterium larrymoorei TaxID=160699 RepID=A0AAF0HDK2_9HYPH|nr:hypothetical protein [Agrobacterium larrymoorei]WHA42555.1 hypothetical protein CFBP5477_014090 [Agrobacterium larrymoorei]
MLDSEIGALDQSENGVLRTDKPFISVYADDSKLLDGLELRSLIKSGQVDLNFEAAVASSQTVTDPNTDESVIYEGVAATDANFEFHLDLTMRQIADTLADPNNDWAVLFSNLILKFEKAQRSRISGDSNGLRLAAHQLKLTVGAVAEPVRGEPLKDASPLARFFAKCETDLIPRIPEMEKKIALMKAQIEGSNDDLTGAMRRFGMIHSEADAMLLTPSGYDP